MNVALNCLSAVLAVLILMVVFACLCEGHIIKIPEAAAQKRRGFIKLFLSLYIPLIIIMALFSIVDVFALQEHSGYLISTTILAIFAFALERVIERTQLASAGAPAEENIATNKAVFSYIDLYSEVERINRDLLQELAKSQSELLSNFDQTQKKVNETSEHINSFIQWQIADCHTLLQERNNMEQFFTNLGSQAAALCAAFSEYEKKLNNSAAALLYCEKGEILSADIEESFAAMYQQTARELLKRIDETERRLQRVLTQYSSFKDYMRPYNEKLDVYGSRMESTMQSLQKSSDAKQAVLHNTGTEIKQVLDTINDKMENTLLDVDSFLKQNSFVLSLILDTYRGNARSNRDFKKLLESWPATPQFNPSNPPNHQFTQEQKNNAETTLF
ncbi:hypothetical protein ACYULU_04210 [Breznakiellaceae bacterium SP9]